MANELDIDKDKKFALFHNHSSSNLKNSKCDVMVTERIVKILEKVDLEFIDHFIVSRNGINTFATPKNFNKPKIVNEKNNDIILNKSKWEKKEIELERD